MKSPAFQFYPSDWLSSRAIRLMDAEQRGWYIQLLAEAWESDPQATLPNDDQLLRVLAGVNTRSTDVEQRWEFVRGQFRKKGSVVYNERQMEEVIRQEVNRQKKSEAGKASADARKKQREAIRDQHLTKGTRSNRRSTGVGTVLNTSSTEGVTESNSPIPSSITTPPVEEKIAHRALRDARLDHPALMAVREIKGRFPHKDVWDLVIKVAGPEPDVERMHECWIAWRGKNFGPENLGWLTDWYVNGIPGANGNGQQKPTASERRVDQLKSNVEFIRSGGRHANR